MTCITVLSDFGLQDPSVAIARGILMQYAPEARTVDITHEIQPFNILQAAYVLGASYKNFPDGTFHLALFDIFSENKPALILTKYNNHYFLTPDNGLLPLALDIDGLAGLLCFELQKVNSFHEWINKAGVIIQSLEVQKIEEIGLPKRILKPVPNKQKETNGVIECEVIHIDIFENVVINFTQKHYDEFSKGRKFRLNFIQYEDIDEISVNYTDVKRGYKLCRFNSNGYLEISINGGRAASLFGLRIGSKNNKIQISFE